MFKKISTTLALSVFFVQNAFAQGMGFWNNPQTGTAPDAATTQSLGQSITSIVNFFLGILGLIAVVFLIYAGILMVTAGGEEEQVTKAKKIIMYAAGGIVVILLSYTIVQFVTSALG